MLKKLFVLCFVCSLSGTAVAGGGVRVDDMRDKWGGGTMTKCGDNVIENTNACIGNSATTSCAGWTNKGTRYDDEYAIAMMVAHKINEYGAYFCPTQIEAMNDDHDSWTQYADATGGNCVWLCRTGYTGAECKTSVASYTDGCDITNVNRDAFSGVRVTRNGANIEDGIPMFIWNDYGDCKAHGENEHDMILAIRDWAPSGHGAFARQFVVFADRKDWDYMKSSPNIYPAAGSIDILVCQHGYQPNAQGSDCIAIDELKCTEATALANMCDGWTNGYNRDNHVFKRNGTCNEYRCKDAGFGFSPQTRNCVECPTNMRSGVNPLNGECMTCDVSQVFDANTPGTFCAQATGYTKTDLQYGDGKTKNSNRNIACQCWTISTPDDYKVCVRTPDTYKTDSKCESQ